MTRTIERNYSFSEREVREAILAWLQTKDLPRPGYVADVTTATETVRWGSDNGNITLRWTERDEVGA